jgi:hypothetical protein
VQDALHSTGYKKSQIQKALDTLSESGRITCTVRCDARALCAFAAGCLHCEPDVQTRALTRFRTRLQENGKQKIYLALQPQSTVPPEVRLRAVLAHGVSTP